MSILTLTYREQSTVAELTAQLRPNADILLVHQSVSLSESEVQMMHNALYSAAMYAAASPRAHSSTVLSLPFDLPQSVPLSSQREEALKAAAAQLLPEYQRVPEPLCACVLLKQSVIERCGFLSCAFQTIPGAIVDFCYRVNRVGYSIVAANRVYIRNVPHNICDEALFAKDMGQLRESYAESFDRIEKYKAEEIRAADYFLEVLASAEAAETKYLLDVTALDDQLTQRLDSVKRFCACASVTVVASQRQREQYGLDQLGINVVLPEALREKYPIGYVLGGFLGEEQYRYINEHCLRVVCDIPSWAVAFTHQQDDLCDQLRLLLQYADACFVDKEDLLRYQAAFLHEPPLLERMIPVEYHGRADEETDQITASWEKQLCALAREAVDAKRLEKRFRMFRLMGQKSKLNPPPENGKPLSLLARLKRKAVHIYSSHFRWIKQLFLRKAVKE